MLGFGLRLAAPATVGALAGSSQLQHPTQLSACEPGTALTASGVELRRRLTPIGRTSLLTELDTNRSVPMFMLRVK